MVFALHIHPAFQSSCKMGIPTFELLYPGTGKRKIRSASGYIIF